MKSILHVTEEVFTQIFREAKVNALIDILFGLVTFSDKVQINSHSIYSVSNHYYFTLIILHLLLFLELFQLESITFMVHKHLHSSFNSDFPRITIPLKTKCKSKK